MQPTKPNIEEETEKEFGFNDLLEEYEASIKETIKPKQSEQVNRLGDTGLLSVPV